MPQTWEGTMAGVRLFNVHRTWEDWLGIVIGVLICIAGRKAAKSHAAMADCVAIHLWLRPRRRTQVLAFRPWRRRRAACGAGALAGLEAERQGACQAGAIARTWTRI